MSHPCGVCTGTACTCSKTYTAPPIPYVKWAWECGQNDHDFQAAPRKQYGHGIEGHLILYCRKCGTTRDGGA